MRPHVVGIGGTTRSGSSTERALAYSLDELERLGTRVTAFHGLELAALPLYAPEQEERTAEAERLIGALRSADAVVIASPGYHGTISGLIKNALDYIEDMAHDDPPYLTGRPVGCIAVGYGWQAIVTTLETLRTIGHALRAWPTPLGATINSAGPVFGEGGCCVDERAAFQLKTLASEVMDFVEMRRSSLEP